MSSERAPFAALDDSLSQTQHLLISFDGPVCSLFAGIAVAGIADSLREVFAQESVRVPETIEHTGNWLEIFSYAASVSPDLAVRVESELTALEFATVTTAALTPKPPTTSTTWSTPEQARSSSAWPTSRSGSERARPARPVASCDNSLSTASRAHLRRAWPDGQDRVTEQARATEGGRE
jgi:hypothetical protein